MGGGQTPLAALFRASGRVRKEEEKIKERVKGRVKDLIRGPLPDSPVETHIIDNIFQPAAPAGHSVLV